MSAFVVISSPWCDIVMSSALLIKDISWPGLFWESGRFRALRESGWKLGPERETGGQLAVLDRAGVNTDLTPADVTCHVSYGWSSRADNITIQSGWKNETEIESLMEKQTPLSGPALPGSGSWSPKMWMTLNWEKARMSDKPRPRHVPVSYYRVCEDWIRIWLWQI